MFPTLSAFARQQRTRLSARANSRWRAGALALLVEALLVLVVISMGLAGLQDKKPKDILVSVDVRDAPDQAPEQAQPEPTRPSKPIQQPQPPQDAPVPPVVQPSAPPIIPLSRNQMATIDVANLPRSPQPSAAPPRPNYGPPDTGSPGDSKRVSTAPNGEPLYAASWYREPYDDELSGYLSTASGPGWALIACRTVADFRVEDCVGLGEYPSGSQIERAILAAAWQFRVRPPRRGGISRVGEWVRIRIDYEERRR